jgi:hypothetical protein
MIGFVGFQVLLIAKSSSAVFAANRVIHDCPSSMFEALIPMYIFNPENRGPKRCGVPAEVESILGRENKLHIVEAHSELLGLENHNPSGPKGFGKTGPKHESPRRMGISSDESIPEYK